MNSMESPISRCRSFSSPMICAFTVTSSADVGSSATSTDGPEDQGPRDRDALPLAARKLVRVALAEAAVEADLLEPVERQLASARAASSGRGCGAARR